MEIKTRNVNAAFKTMVELFQTKEYCGDVRPSDWHGGRAPIISRPSRNGPVLMIDEPCTITYERPTERVLFNTARDANPAFHLYESLWMLAGRNDVAPLAYYASRMKTFSDDGGTLNGAYGYRWRNWNGYGTSPDPALRNGADQLRTIIAHLKADPTSRRAVLQMWNTKDDLLKIGQHPERSGNFYNPDLNFPPSKDVCCNLSVLFSIRQCTSCDGTGIYKGRYTPDDPTSPYVEEPCENHEQRLDMTVFNRSNDLIWGALGANAVHFSVLQEYMAAQLGVEVGRYNQISNNMHVYESNFKPEEWLAYYDSDDEVEYVPACNIVPLVRDPAVFDREVGPFVQLHSSAESGLEFWGGTEPFLATVADPMLKAFHAYKLNRDAPTERWTDHIEADDWRTAATQWIERRKQKRAVTKV